jgi:hypothetical protein
MTVNGICSKGFPEPGRVVVSQCVSLTHSERPDTWTDGISIEFVSEVEKSM